ncbi:unnamed protein product [Rhizoctonia solani]|uniref:Alcohol oxidase n=1 Tax=Rhizoctonia solani TaxID=456999 RepID=A0A8H2WHA1_9AGAM|nr:unnamed protein product [Rhizoctonia solani]
MTSLSGPMEVDIIFVGGGTSACVAAGRLAAANPELHVLLVEQGPNNFQDPTVLTPALFMDHLAPDSKHAIFWKGNKSEAAKGREAIVPTGGILGGGSRYVTLRYGFKLKLQMKGNLPENLDSQIETYHVAPGRDTHGYDGPIHVSYGDHFAQVAQEYLDVCTKRGIPKVEDLMDLYTGHGCARLAKYIHPETGHRQDAAHRYIHGQSGNKRLHVMTKTLVKRILFDGTKAAGVEVIGNKNQDKDANQTPREIRARKLVVVSAGAIGSAVVLQRSGLGQANQLSELGIKVVADLPVGANYEDHSSCIATYHVADDLETLDLVMERDPSVMERYLAQFIHGKGLLTSNVTDAGSKIRPTAEELERIGPAFREVWKRQFESAPDKPVFIQTVVNGFLGPRTAVPKNSRFMMFGHIAAYPVSKGHVHITSADPYSLPDFSTGFFEEKADVEIQVWIYKKTREIARRMPSYRGEYAPLHPKYPEGSSASCVRLDSSPSFNTEDLVYTEEDDIAIEEFVRQRGDTTWHSVATIQMKPKEKGGCVDSRLNVYGTENLKVADLSILPKNVGSNTYSTALLIGEKAALLIAEDLKLVSP